MNTLNDDIKNSITTASEGFDSAASGDSASSSTSADDSASAEGDASSDAAAAEGIDAETAKNVFKEVATGINEAMTKNNDSIKTALENINTGIDEAITKNKDSIKTSLEGVTTGIEESINETLPSTFDKISKTWYKAKRDLIIDEINKTLDELTTQIQYNI